MTVKQISGGRLLREFVELNRSYGPECAKKKVTLLRDLGKARLGTAEQLITYHDLLCFMRAYPDNADVERISERELQRFSKRVNKYRRESNDPEAEELANTGIVNTETRHPFGFELSLILKKRHGSRISLILEDNSGDWEDKLLDYLPLIVAWNENDSIDNDDNFELAEFLKRVKGKRKRDTLQGLLSLILGAEAPAAIRRYFFESLDLEINFDLTTSAASRTLCRLPGRRTFYFDRPLRKRCTNLHDELKKQPGRLVRLSEKKGREVIAVACEVLAVRNRELYPVTLADPAEIYKSEVGRGLQIYLFATPPGIRLPLEANFGAMFTRNGMPVGYGIAATLFDRVEIAINVFPAFRSGESAYIIEQFFRVFYHHFGSRVFLVRSMQMGNDEEEALHSGAFWFYYKLGFRAINKKVRALANEEFRKQKQKKGYRTSLAKMKQLAKSDVIFLADGRKAASWQEPSLVRLAYVVTDYFANHNDGDRIAGTQRAVTMVSKALGISNTSGWKDTEQLAFRRLAPLLASIRNLSGWSSSDKRSLIKIIRTKGSGLERDYSLQCLKHLKFRETIETLAGVRSGKQSGRR